MEITKESVLVEETICERHFDTDFGTFSFPCNSDGHVKVEGLNPAAKANHAKCVATGTGSVRVEHISFWAPAEGKCECGAKVVLSDSWANQCPKCPREFNKSGQLLAPRSQWGEETGEQGLWG